MDFERINLLLSVVHKSMNVPGTNNIRNAALDELEDWNTGVLTAKDEPELDFEGEQE